MGSTANGVLHGANCDVLAVRVGAREVSWRCSPHESLPAGLR